MSIDTNPRHHTAMRLWDVFYDVVKHVHGSHRRKGNGVFSHPDFKTFDRLAGWCIEHEIDPEDYIRTVSSTLLGAGRYSFKIADFAHQAQRTRYLKMKESNDGGDPEVRWKIQAAQLMATVARAPDMYPDPMDPLIVFDTPYDPWFRVLYPETPIPTVMKVFGRIAWEELAQNGALRRYIRQKRPATLRLLEKQYGSFVD